jgi:hypothetical protein
MMDFKTACEIAESADLPDGAYCAMIGDLMGLTYEAVMELFFEQATLVGEE